MTTLQEYSLEFKPTNIVKVQGLCKLVMQGTSDEEQEEDRWKDEPMMYTQHIPYVPGIEGSYYNELKYYLQHETSLSYINDKKKIALRLNSLQYKLQHGILFRNNYDGVLLSFLEKQDVDKVLKDIHDGLV
jgi:hypothetical protein